MGTVRGVGVGVNGCPPLALACRTASAGRDLAGTLMRVLDAAFALRAAVWTAASLLAFGLVSAIIPNPVFGRSVPPEPFAYFVWVVSAPLMGLIAATYGRRPWLPEAPAVPVEIGPHAASSAAGAPGVAGGVDDTGRGTTAATVGSAAAFIAIGCPLCNKVALLLLGASGALTVFAPLQPVIGAASLALLAVTLWWRLRIVATGGACAVAAS